MDIHALIQRDDLNAFELLIKGIPISTILVADVSNFPNPTTSYAGISVIESIVNMDAGNIANLLFGELKKISTHSLKLSSSSHPPMLPIHVPVS